MNKKFLLLIILVLTFKFGHAQHLMYSTYNNEPEISASGSIIFLPGFTVPSGSNFRAYIVDCLPLAAAPSQDQNYIISTTVRTDNITNVSQMSNLTVCDLDQAIHYFDGLGRPLQTVNVKGSPDMRDIVQPVDYDKYGREAVKYLAYEDPGMANGSYKSNALTAGQGVSAFYNPSGSTGTQQANGIIRTASPYGVTVFEPSPLNREQEQGAPGDVWQPAASRTTTSGRTLITTYGLNNALTDYATTGFAVRLWTTTAGPAGQTHRRTLSSAGLYAANELFLTISKDENWTSVDGKAGTKEEYKDKEGRVVLKRLFNKTGAASIEPLSTYYVYDDLGNLSFVLPPGASPDGATSGSATLGATTLDNLCYQYFYDGRSRLIEKKLPGKGWEYMVYNTLDQLTMSQDGVQRGKATQEWLVTKYDSFGRVVITGIFAHTGSVANADNRSAIQTLVDNQTNQWEIRTTTGIGYTTNRTYPTTVLTTTLSISYYDDYSIPGLPVVTPYNQAGSYSSMTKGLPTVTRTNVLGTSNMLWVMMYYDNEGRLVKIINQHYKGGVFSDNNYDELSNTYSFVGEVKESIRRHYVSGVEKLYVANEYTYDHQGRKKDSYQRTGDNASTTNPKVLLGRNNYNPIGQLKSKGLHSTNTGSSFAQTVNYQYNARGWMENLSSALFSETLKYESTISGVVSQFNGNISRQEWGTGKYYNYTYDRISRLLTAIGDDGNNESLGYDKMGNITSLQRHRLGVVEDQLSYAYTGNKLTSVVDASAANSSLEYQLPGTTTYLHDFNGSMTSRSNTVNMGNNIASISYNHLNLPQGLTASGAAITYTYDANGTKLRKKIASSTLDNDYIGGIHYEGGELKFLSTEVGRVLRISATNYSYEYTLADHLGNGRVYFDINAGSARKIQETDYFAFGLAIQRSLIGGENKYSYNGKEKQDQEKMYDYGARFYDPVIGRWNVIDPLAEKYHTISPYAYVANNPAIAYDGDGRKIIYVNGFFSRLLNLGGFAPGAAKEGYWNFFSPTFITSSRQFMGATDSELNEFIDGSSYAAVDQDGGDRYERGMQYAMENYDELIKGMKKGETFKFVSHSEGGGFAAGMAAYLISKGQTVENMLYLSPDEVDDKFSSPIGTFSIQSHFQEDGISPSKRLEGVDVYMNFSTLNGKKPGFGGNHGATVTSANIKKIKNVMGKFGPDAKKILSNGRWTVTETKNGYTFKREQEEEEDED